MLVAGIRRAHAEELLEHDITTLEALGDHADGVVGDIRPETFETIRR